MTKENKELDLASILDRKMFEQEREDKHRLNWEKERAAEMRASQEASDEDDEVELKLREALADYLYDINKDI